MKRIVAIVVALVAAWFIMKVLWWLFTAAFTIAMNLFMIVLMVAIAAPLYLIISRRLR